MLTIVQESTNNKHVSMIKRLNNIKGILKFSNEMINNVVPYGYDVRKEKNKSKEISVPGPLKSLKKKISNNVNNRIS